MMVGNNIYHGSCNSDPESPAVNPAYTTDSLKLTKILNFGICLKSHGDSNYGLGYIPYSSVEDFRNF